MPTSPVARRALGVTAVLTAVGTAFTAGVVAGSAAPPESGVLEEAADSIATSALRPVDRRTLDDAAIQGMLAAAGDHWGSWSAAAARPPSPTSPVLTTLEPGDEGLAIARISVRDFAPGVAAQVRAAVAGAGGSAGVLLDLRGNPGGRLDEAVEVASTFLPGGPVVSYARRGDQPRRLDAVGTGDPRTPLVVLVDGGTASAAEVVAGALQDRGRAVLVGERTFGKGSVQEPLPLGDGSALQLTVARYRTPAGRDVEGVGLVPDLEVAPDAPADTAVQRGLEVLRGLQLERSLS